MVRPPPARPPARHNSHTHTACSVPWPAGPNLSKFVFGDVSFPRFNEFGDDCHYYVQPINITRGCPVAGIEEPVQTSLRSSGLREWGVAGNTPARTPPLARPAACIQQEPEGWGFRG